MSSLHTFILPWKPQYNEGPRDGQSVFATTITGGVGWLCLSSPLPCIFSYHPFSPDLHAFPLLFPIILELPSSALSSPVPQAPPVPNLSVPHAPTPCPTSVGSITFPSN